MVGERDSFLQSVSICIPTYNHSRLKYFSEGEFKEFSRRIYRPFSYFGNIFEGLSFLEINFCLMTVVARLGKAAESGSGHHEATQVSAKSKQGL